MGLKLEDVLIKPILSEKVSKVADKYNRYGFVVNLRANKYQIKAAVEGLYNVEVLDVLTSVLPAKSKRTPRGGPLKGTSRKRALVKLASGQKIEFFKGV